MSVTLKTEPGANEYDAILTKAYSISQLRYTFVSVDNTISNYDSDSGLLRFTCATDWTTLPAPAIEAGDVVTFNNIVGGVLDGQTITGVVNSVSTTNITINVGYSGASTPATGDAFVNRLGRRLVIRYFPGQLENFYSYSPLTDGNYILDLGQTAEIIFESLPEDNRDIVWTVGYYETWTDDVQAVSWTDTKEILILWGRRSLGNRLGASFRKYLLTDFLITGGSTSDNGGFHQININSSPDDYAPQVDYWVGQTVEYNGLKGKITFVTYVAAGTINLSTIVTDIPWTSDLGVGIPFFSVFDNEKGELLTDFKSNKGAYWKGWKNYVYYIIDPDLALRHNSVQTFQGPSDINKQNLAASTNVDTVTAPYTAQVRKVLLDESLITAYPNTAFFRIGIRDGLGTPNVSPTYFIPVREECPRALMVEWLNKDGGYDQWLFSVSQNIANNTDTLDFESSITQSYDTLQRTNTRLIGKTRQVITVFADNVTLYEYRGLADMLKSPEIFIWADREGERRIPVVVSGDASAAYRTDVSRLDFTALIQMPVNTDILDLLEYEWREVSPALQPRTLND